MRFIVVMKTKTERPAFWNSDLSVTGRCTVQKISATYGATGMKKRKKLEKRKVRSHNKVR